MSTATKPEGWKTNPQSRQQMIETNQRLNRRCQQIESDLAKLTKVMLGQAKTVSYNIDQSNKMVRNSAELLDRLEAQRQQVELTAHVTGEQFNKLGFFRRFLWRMFFSKR